MKRHESTEEEEGKIEEDTTRRGEERRGERGEEERRGRQEGSRWTLHRGEETVRRSALSSSDREVGIKANMNVREMEEWEEET